MKTTLTVIVLIVVGTFAVLFADQAPWVPLLAFCAFVLAGTFGVLALIDTVKLPNIAAERRAMMVSIGLLALVAVVVMFIFVVNVIQDAANQVDEHSSR
jgi:membrane protease YdiL (CAAX protease family)